MRIVREQMLCVISDNWRGPAAELSTGSAAFEALFRDSGVVHFASFALLPPRPGAGDQALPSLLLELAVDEGVRPVDVLTRLAHHPSGALRNLHAVRLQQQTVPSRNEELLGQLLADLSVSDGGFVGPRDRSLAQVRQERVLYDAVRAQVPHIPAARKNDRASFAAALASWARASPPCECANSVSPRSFWRAGGGAVKLIVLAAMVPGAFFLAWLASLAFAGLEALWASWAARLWGPLYDFVDAVLKSLASVFDYVVQVGLRVLRVLAAAVVLVAVYAAIVSVVRALGGPVERWFKALARELDRPTDSWSARTAHVFMWLVAGVVVIEAAALIDYVLDIPKAVAAARTWLAAWLDPGITAGLHRVAAIVAPMYGALAKVYVAAFFMLLLVLALGLRSARDSEVDDRDNFLTQCIKRLRQAFHHPKEEAIPRAQQVHESIERCEAENVGGTAHMISLTELRWPYAWSALWTRLSLRFVTTAGYILFTEGSLGNAPGIQFSHWHIVDRGRRLLFCANFDGTFGGYLDDFIKGPSTGTTLFWRWTHLLPRRAAATGHPAIANPRRFAPTRLIIYRGVKCELKFKTYARESMLPYLYRYAASQQTLEQKNRATGLRDALCGARNDVNDDRIMRAIES